MGQKRMIFLISDTHSDWIYELKGSGDMEKILTREEIKKRSKPIFDRNDFVESV